MFERFTRSARAAILAGVGEAERRGDLYVGSEHLLLGLANAPSEMVRQAIDVPIEDLRAGLNSLDQAALTSSGITAERLSAASMAPPPLTKRKHLPFTDGAKQVLEVALKDAIAMSDRHIGPEHMLIAITQSPPHDVSSQLLNHVGLSQDTVRASLVELLRRSA